MSSSKTYYPTACPEWMTREDIKAEEQLHKYFYMWNETRKDGEGNEYFLHELIPSWSRYYDPNDDEYTSFDHQPEPTNVQKPAPKKVQKPAKPSANRFAVLGKITENATTWTPKPVVVKRK